MSRVLSVLVLLLALAGVLLWNATRSRTERAPRAQETVLPGKEIEQAPAPALAGAPPHVAHDPAEPAAPAARREAAATRDAGLDRAPVAAQDLAPTPWLGLAVSGRVVDDLGKPLESFEVLADRAGPEPDFDEDGELSRSFRDAGGSFRMEGFEPGVWTVWGRSGKHAESAPASVTLPGGEPLVLVVPRESIVSGRVLDPSGTPVAGARVQATHAGSRRPHFYSQPEYRANELGCFRIDALQPGIVTLQAFGLGWAPSASESIELRAGETPAEIALWLRPGAVLLGEVLGADGRPQSGRRVSIGDLQGFHATLHTDQEGRFQASDLPPGELAVWAETSEGTQLQERVALREGETARVRLAPPGGPVRLHGHVRAGAEPLASARVYARRVAERAGPSGASASAETGADGAYELRVPGSGLYWFSIQGDGEILLSWRATVEVPEVEAYEFDAAIPLGRVSGRVTDAAGVALVGVLVQSEPERAEAGASGSTRALTDAEGNYELRVPAGQHAVKAGGDLDGFWERVLPYAEARVGSLVVSADGHLRGVDFRLETGGILEGIVSSPDGTGAARAWVSAHDDSSVQQYGFCEQAGRFRIRLAPGSYRIEAGPAGALEDRLACAPVQVAITTGETRQVEFELVPARHVLLTTLHEGRPVACDLQVLDAHGWPRRVRWGENGETRLGPLVPGRYTIRAQRDGKTVERALEVTDAERELAIELVLE